jgi:E3 ubiquitin-protein ligase RFWD3
MDGGKTCSICFGEYTNMGGHRITSLKCGHLFGYDCIYRWCKIYKKSYCPSCSAPFKIAHLRTIFASEITAIDTRKENEMIEKYVQVTEKNKTLEKEIKNLKAQIDILKHSLKNKGPEQIAEPFKLHIRFLKYEKVHFPSQGSLIEYEPINAVFLISCYKNSTYGIYKYSASDFSINSFIKLAHKVNDIKVSPYKDGLALIASGTEILLMNIYNENVIFRMDFSNIVTAVNFDSSDRDLLHACDAVGNFHVYNLKTTSSTTKKICSHSIINISQIKKCIYVTSLFSIFIIELSPLCHINHTEVAIDLDGICVCLCSDNENALAVLRDQNFKICCVFFGNKEIVFDPEIKQSIRHKERIYGGYIYLTDDYNQCIKVLHSGSQKMAYSYKFKEAIVNISVSQKLLAILTVKGLYIFDN